MPDVSMSTHQAAKFSTNPKASLDAAVKRVGKHLFGASDEGLTHVPNEDKGLEVFANADFDCGFNTTTAEDPASFHSRTVFVIKCAS